jgi:hypothetical protein
MSHMRGRYLVLFCTIETGHSMGTVTTENHHDGGIKVVTTQ